MYRSQSKVKGKEIDDNDNFLLLIKLLQEKIRRVFCCSLKCKIQFNFKAESEKVREGAE